MKRIEDLAGQMAELSVVKQQLAGLDERFDQQLARIDQLQVKVDLSMTSLGEVKHDHEEIARALKSSTAQPPPPSPIQEPVRDGAGIMGAPPQPPPLQQQPFQARPATPYTTTATSRIYDPDDPGGSKQRKQWLPKMDFPRFDGNKPIIWIDQCNDYFKLYQIPEGFKVTAASMHMIDDAAMWLQSYKKMYDIVDWNYLCAAVLGEFEINGHRRKMSELLQLRQRGTVTEYRKQFEHLMYELLLYEQ